MIIYLFIARKRPRTYAAATGGPRGGSGGRTATGRSTTVKSRQRKGGKKHR